jgi:hypothetical protein
MEQELIEQAINILSPIKEDNFITGTFKKGGCYCAISHLNMGFNNNTNCLVSNQGVKLNDLVNKFLSPKIDKEWGIIYPSIVSVNDNSLFIKELYPQETPKQRVLALLNDLKQQYI